jgi:hypothetical protein
MKLLTENSGKARLTFRKGKEKATLHLEDIHDLVEGKRKIQEAMAEHVTPFVRDEKTVANLQLIVLKDGRECFDGRGTFWSFGGLGPVDAAVELGTKLQIHS